MQEAHGERKVNGAILELLCLVMEQDRGSGTGGAPLKLHPQFTALRAGEAFACPQFCLRQFLAAPQAHASCFLSLQPPVFTTSATAYRQWPERFREEKKSGEGTRSRKELSTIAEAGGQ